MVRESDRAVDLINHDFVRYFPARVGPMVGVKSESDGAISDAGIPASVAYQDLGCGRLHQTDMSHVCSSAINFSQGQRQCATN